MKLGATKELSREIKAYFTAAVIRGKLEQVKSCLAKIKLDPKDRNNLAVEGIEWAFASPSPHKSLQVVNYLLSLPQTSEWFGERSRPIEISYGMSFDFNPNEKEERAERFHSICTKIWAQLKELSLTKSPLATDIINHLLQIAQNNSFETPVEFNAYKRMSLSSVWNAFTAIPARVSRFLFTPSQSASSGSQELTSPKSPALNDCECASDDSDADFLPESDDENDEDYQPGSDSDYNSSDESDCDSEFDNARESDSDNFDLAAYENWKKSEKLRQSAKRVALEKPTKCSDVDSDDAHLKRQRRG